MPSGLPSINYPTWLLHPKEQHSTEGAYAQKNCLYGAAKAAGELHKEKNGGLTAEPDLVIMEINSPLKER